MKKLYDLICVDCGHVFEKLLKDPSTIKENQVTCPECGSSAVNSAVSVPHFTLNGSGWAKDGYRGGGNHGS